MRRTLLIPTLLVAACATAPVPTPKPAPSGLAPAVAPTAATAANTENVTAAADLADHLGDSPETAVPVPKDEPNEGIDFQKRWIYERYGRFRVKKWGIAHAGEGPAERRYKVITIERPDGTERVVYFDITENWNAWKPST